MSDDRIDFGVVDPTRDPERFERVVGSVMERAGPELAARRRRRGVLGEISSWWKPTLVAAAVAGLLYVGVLAGIPTEDVPEDVPEEETAGIAEAIGVPSTVAEWVRSGESTTPEELLLTLEGTR